MCGKIHKKDIEYAISIIFNSFEKTLKEYGEDVIEIHTDAISSEDVVLIHDDLLATGGSMKAAIDLVDSFGAKKIYVNFLIELRMEGLKGKEFLGNKAEITALLTLNE